MIKPVAGLYTCLILVAVSMQAVSQDQRELLRTLLPGEDAIQGWSRTDSVRIYEGENLFSFIDGGAVLFFEYGFARVLAAEFQNAQSESISLEIYEMKDPGAAYGIYSVRIGDRATPMTIGQEGSMQAHYIMFWKGNYYISIAASDSTSRCRVGMEALGRDVDRRILNKGERPALVSVMPPEGLFRVRYIRGVLGLSTVYPFDAPDIFQSSDGGVGNYSDHALFVLRYGSDSEAQQRVTEAGRMFKSNDHFTSYYSDQGIITVNDRRNQTLCITRAGPYIVIALSSQTSTAISSCQKVASSLSPQ